MQCDNGVIADNRGYAKHLVKILNLHSYMETSAKSGEHVEEVFESAISLVRAMQCYRPGTHTFGCRE